MKEVNRGKEAASTVRKKDGKPRRTVFLFL